jgi:hypothetical protein
MCTIGNGGVKPVVSYGEHICCKPKGVANATCGRKRGMIGLTRPMAVG